jgi:hypothetical protein
LQIPKALYIALCVAVPPLWGLVSYWLFDLVARRWPRKPGNGTPEPADDQCDRV